MDIFEKWEYYPLLGQYGYGLEDKDDGLHFLCNANGRVSRLIEEIGKIDGIAVITNIGFSEIVTISVSRNKEFHRIWQNDASVTFPRDGNPAKREYRNPKTSPSGNPE